MRIPQTNAFPTILSELNKVSASNILLVFETNFALNNDRFRGWQAIHWGLFSVPYFLLIIFSIMEFYHWHRKRCLKEAVLLQKNKKASKNKKY